ncbi:hypothetical protein TRIUR3_33370 [Triticum urartu]|uniref:Helicase ATP-binding domain-containing protein n=1 Tax=Triticum urartu TaxID=4572 RepID=M8A106_TRIUA|nr:hypothetical protein TRIUR3_33370 [Triticum urartu]
MAAVSTHGRANKTDEARSEEYTGGMTDDKLDTGVLLTVIQPTCPDRLHIGMMDFYGFASEHNSVSADVLEKKAYLFFLLVTKQLLRILSYTLHTFQGNKDLSDVTHVIVDEVHERTILSNFLLIVLKSLVENALINQEES